MAYVGTGGSCGGSGQVVHYASVQGGWVEVNTDLQTADSATNLLKPHLVTRAAVVWQKVPALATRILIRGRNLAAMSAAGTPAAVVRIIGAFGDPITTNTSSSTTTVWGTSPTATNGGVFMRLDNADAGATGLTLTFATSGNLEDASYEYTDLVDLTGVDLKGCQYVTALVETACALTGSATTDCQVKFIN